MKFLYAAAAGLAVLAAPASAENIQFKVEYADLNLKSPEGQKALERRIDHAARVACGYNTRITGTRMRAKEARQCVADLKAKANQQFAVMINGSEKGG